MAREALEFALESGDAPLTCMRYAILAWVLLSRGKLDEAEQAMGESLAFLDDQPEPQVAILLVCPRADLENAHGRHDQAIAILREGAELSNTYNVDQIPLVVLQLIRELLERGERDEAIRAREILAHGTTPGALAATRIADGLLTPDPQEAVTILREACGQIEEIGLRLDLIRGLLDLGRAERAAGIDPRPSFERARDLGDRLRRPVLPPAGRRGTGRDLSSGPIRLPGPDLSVQALVPAAPDHRPFDVGQGLRLRRYPKAPLRRPGRRRQVTGSGFRTR